MQKVVKGQTLIKQNSNLTFSVTVTNDIDHLQDNDAGTHGKTQTGQPATRQRETLKIQLSRKL